MASLALTTVGTWSNQLSTGRIARWGDAIVNYYRKTSGGTDTEVADTGAAGSFSTVTVTGTMFGGASQGDDTYIYFGGNTTDLFRVATDGSRTDIGNLSGSAGWGMIHAGHPSKVVTKQNDTSGSRITLYDRPGGGAPDDIVVSGSSSLGDTIEVDPSTGDIYASTFIANTSRGVRKYQDDGTLLWDIDLPNASNGDVYVVNGLAFVGSWLVAYTTDIDEPGGTRVNNNWWLLDPTTGDASLLDVTIDGVDFATWADTGSQELEGDIGCLSVLDGVIYTAARGTTPLAVLGGSLIVDTGGLTVGPLQMRPT